ncbi:uncharacterized protein LOC101216011 isoform X2 [Cucumis sativus]|uniref:uncharacterized protein LOC101216011 isoform X2 n=1 Tax=Cucumis sativus TaxID=3659 RepID=UPI0005EC94BA|nr:uncharacterized protein LOC101216011 isoform X2 [Cucumis sativus]KAE8650890.1 hypothetical protein Csa_001044 [Cucumis sativus]
MAATNHRSPLLPLKSFTSLQPKPLGNIFMLKTPKISVNRPLALQITSSLKNNLVFEDRSNGVICYRDDDGEIICEGYDDEEIHIEEEIEKLPCEKPDGRDGEVKMDRLLLQTIWEKQLESINGGAGSGRGEIRIGANGYNL